MGVLWWALFWYALLYVQTSFGHKVMREGSPYLACNDRNAFFTSEKPKKYHAWSCQNVCDALTFLLDNIFVRFGTKLYRQVVGIFYGHLLCSPGCRFIPVLL